MTVNPKALILRAKILGALIRDARLSSGKDIEECAQAIGVSVEAFQAFELGSQPPSLPELECIAFHLDIPLDHFWESAPLAEASEGRQKPSDMTRLISLRHRMVGAQVRQARLGAGLSAEKIAEYLGVDAAQVQAYELGKTPIPLPHLEMLSGLLNRSIREFYDRHGPVGEWTTQRRAVEDFLRIPLELQEFVSKPINRPYLELAQRLSEMSVDKLRAVAEGLLEITY